MTVFFQQLINGLSLGSIYALIALGYTMVYGIIKLINFAHGDIYMLGAYIGFMAITVLGVGFFPALLTQGWLRYFRCSYWTGIAYKRCVMQLESRR